MNSDFDSSTRVILQPTFNKDELRAIENLAWMVKNSKQNVGLRMLDAAESVIKILKRKMSFKDKRQQEHDNLSTS